MIQETVRIFLTELPNASQGLEETTQPRGSETSYWLSDVVTLGVAVNAMQARRLLETNSIGYLLNQTKAKRGIATVYLVKNKTSTNKPKHPTGHRPSPARLGNRMGSGSVPSDWDRADPK